MPRPQRTDTRELESLTDAFILDIGPNSDRSRKRLEVFRYLRGLIVETFREWRVRQWEAQRDARVASSSPASSTHGQLHSNEEGRVPRGSGEEKAAGEEGTRESEPTQGQPRQDSASAPGDACSCPCCVGHRRKDGTGAGKKTAYCPVCKRPRRESDVETHREDKAEGSGASGCGEASNDAEQPKTRGGGAGETPEWCLCEAGGSGDGAASSQKNGAGPTGVGVSVAGLQSPASDREGPSSGDTRAVCQCRCCRVRRAQGPERGSPDRDSRRAGREDTDASAPPEGSTLRDRCAQSAAPSGCAADGGSTAAGTRMTSALSWAGSPVSSASGSSSVRIPTPLGRGASEYRAEEDEINITVYRYGSFPLRTFLPDGDLDIGIISYNRRTGVVEGEEESDALLAVLLDKFQREDVKTHKTFPLREASLVDAEVRILKCIVSGIAVDVSVNKVGGCCSLVFLELADRRIGRHHLFKRSVLLIKSWFAYESHLLGSRSGLLATYCVEALVLHLFHVLPASLLPTPLHLLYHFFSYYSSFHWDRYAVTACGPLPLTFITRASSVPDRRGGSAPPPPSLSSRRSFGPHAAPDATAALPQGPAAQLSPSVLDGLLDSKGQAAPTPPLSPSSLSTASASRPKAEEPQIGKPAPPVGASAPRRRGEPGPVSAPDGGAGATQAPGGRFMGEHWVGVEYEGREAPWLLARRQRKEENGAWSDGDDDPQLERAAVLMLLMQQQRGGVGPHHALTLPGSHAADIGLPLAHVGRAAASEVVLQAQGPSMNMARMMESVEFVEECRYRFRHSYGAYGAATAQRGPGARPFPAFPVAGASASTSGHPGAGYGGGGSASSTPSHSSSLSSFSNRRFPPAGPAAASAGGHAPGAAGAPAGGAPGWRKSPFLFRSMNVVDPLHNGNNLARSVSETAFYRLLHAMKKGLQALTHILATGDAARFRTLFLPNSYQLLDRIKSPDVAYPVLRPLILFPLSSPSLGRPALALSHPRLPLASPRPDLHHPPGQAASPFAYPSSLQKHAVAAPGGGGVEAEKKRDLAHPPGCASAPASTYPPSVASSGDSDCLCRCHSHAGRRAGARKGEKDVFSPRERPEKASSYSDVERDARGDPKPNRERRRSLSRSAPQSRRSPLLAPSAALPAMARDAAAEERSRWRGARDAGGAKAETGKEPASRQDGVAESETRGETGENGGPGDCALAEETGSRSVLPRVRNQDACEARANAPFPVSKDSGGAEERRRPRSSSLGSATGDQPGSSPRKAQRLEGQPETGGLCGGSGGAGASPRGSAVSPKEEEGVLDSDPHASSAGQGRDAGAGSSSEEDDSDNRLYDALLEEEKLSDPLTLGDLEAASLLDLCQLLRQPNSLHAHLVHAAALPPPSASPACEASAASTAPAPDAGAGNAAESRGHQGAPAVSGETAVGTRGDEVLGDICGLGVEVWRRRLEEIAGFLNGDTPRLGHKRAEDGDGAPGKPKRKTRSACEAEQAHADGVGASDVEEALSKMGVDETEKSERGDTSLPPHAARQSNRPAGASASAPGESGGEHEQRVGASGREGASPTAGNGDDRGRNGRQRRKDSCEPTSSPPAASWQESPASAACAGSKLRPRLHLLLPLCSPRVFPFGPHASSPPSPGSARTHSAPSSESSLLGSRHSLPHPREGSDICSLTGLSAGSSCPGGASGDSAACGSGTAATAAGLPSRHASAPGAFPTSVLGGQGVMNPTGSAGGASTPFGASSSRPGPAPLPVPAAYASGSGIYGSSQFVGSAAGNVHSHGPRRAHGAAILYSGGGLALTGTALGDSLAPAGGGVGAGASGAPGATFRPAPVPQRPPQGAHSLVSGPGGRPRRRSMTSALQSAVGEDAAAARGSHTGRSETSASRWNVSQAGMISAPGSVLAAAPPLVLRPQGASSGGESGRLLSSESRSSSRQKASPSGDKGGSGGADKGSLAMASVPPPGALQVPAAIRQQGAAQDGSGLGDSRTETRGFATGMSANSDGSANDGSESVSGSPAPFAPALVASAGAEGGDGDAWPAMVRSALGEISLAASRSRASSVLSSEQGNAATGFRGRSWASVAHAAARLSSADLRDPSAGTSGPSGGCLASAKANESRFKRSSSLAGVGGAREQRDKPGGGRALPSLVPGASQTVSDAGPRGSADARERPHRGSEERSEVVAEKSCVANGGSGPSLTGPQAGTYLHSAAASGAREWSDAGGRLSRDDGHFSGVHLKADGTTRAEVSPRSGRARQAQETTWSSVCTPRAAPVAQSDCGLRRDAGRSSGQTRGDSDVATQDPPRSQSVPSHSAARASSADDGEPTAEAAHAASTRGTNAVGVPGAGDRQGGVSAGPPKAPSTSKRSTHAGDAGGGVWPSASADVSPSHAQGFGRLDAPQAPDFSPDDTVSWPFLPCVQLSPSLRQGRRSSLGNAQDRRGQASTEKGRPQRAPAWVVPVQLPSPIHKTREVPACSWGFEPSPVSVAPVLPGRAGEGRNALMPGQELASSHEPRGHRRRSCDESALAAEASLGKSGRRGTAEETDRMRSVVTPVCVPPAGRARDGVEGGRREACRRRSEGANAEAAWTRETEETAGLRNKTEQGSSVAGEANPNASPWMPNSGVVREGVNKMPTGSGSGPGVEESASVAPVILPSRFSAGLSAPAPVSIGASTALHGAPSFAAVAAGASTGGGSGRKQGSPTSPGVGRSRSSTALAGMSLPEVEKGAKPKQPAGGHSGGEPGEREVRGEPGKTAAGREEGDRSGFAPGRGGKANAPQVPGFEIGETQLSAVSCAAGTSPGFLEKPSSGSRRPSVSVESPLLSSDTSFPVPVSPFSAAPSRGSAVASAAQAPARNWAAVVVSPPKTAASKGSQAGPGRDAVASPSSAAAASSPAAAAAAQRSKANSDAVSPAKRGTHREEGSLGSKPWSEIVALAEAGRDTSFASTGPKATGKAPVSTLAQQEASSEHPTAEEGKDTEGEKGRGEDGEKADQRQDAPAVSSDATAGEPPSKPLLLLFSEALRKSLPGTCVSERDEGMPRRASRGDSSEDPTTFAFSPKRLSFLSGSSLSENPASPRDEKKSRPKATRDSPSSPLRRFSRSAADAETKGDDHLRKSSVLQSSTSSSPSSRSAVRREEEEERGNWRGKNHAEDRRSSQGERAARTVSPRECEGRKGSGDGDSEAPSTPSRHSAAFGKAAFHSPTRKADRSLDWGRSDDVDPPHSFSRKAFFSARTRGVEEDVNWRSTPATPGSSRGGAVSFAGSDGRRMLTDRSPTVAAAHTSPFGSDEAEAGTARRGEDSRRCGDSRRCATFASLLSQVNNRRPSGAAAGQRGREAHDETKKESGKADAVSSVGAQQGRLVRGAWTREALFQRPEVLSAMTPEERQIELEQSKQQLAELQESLMWKTATSKRDKKKASATNRRVERQLASLESLIGILSSMGASTGGEAAGKINEVPATVSSPPTSSH
ncbi:hypothetical protein NCLIV_052020 [Neospora caninum Liverpool]|uniref:PAP/OAS1 substrate-binding-related domain-containing protein n=1 Tax=Neospora caninum (strain Liverpool) TaxID=572307 RepID=F0VL24_NEOCL|nr:hypothetical protein NCLIV_052020 [Neospora caninum Liverpool]CBZ54776.1 hypothetical protein NCLIV_052020 [Neospora caninum Liverpool]CEL69493.1 TPA: hypothetical protein BN1204_052020 [Neospora caninum Liverpool]|eukprot:XP_003884804.1 hypothetical protein NCLIV_052020 [Neospora caninum Liverpool]